MKFTIILNSDHVVMIQGFDNWAGGLSRLR